MAFLNIYVRQIRLRFPSFFPFQCHVQLEKNENQLEAVKLTQHVILLTYTTLKDFSVLK